VLESAPEPRQYGELMDGEPLPVEGGPADAVGDGGMRMRLLRLRARVRGLPGGALIWRIGITVVGLLVIAVGIILLPLPGPGWLIIFAGLGLLATEYTWAAQLLRWVRRRFIIWAQWTRRQRFVVRFALTVATLVFLGAVLAGTWWLYTVR
jgi:uncharacterized protein (TIGR02611 family)